MLWIIFQSWLVHPRGLKQAANPSRVRAIIDDLFILLARCTLLHRHFPLALYPSVRLQPASALFQRPSIYLPPLTLPSTPCLLHPVPYPPRSPHYSPQTPGFVYYRGEASEKPALSTLRNPRDFHFIRKQLPLNIFIRRLIILRGDARSAIAYIYGGAALCRYTVRLLSLQGSSSTLESVPMILWNVESRISRFG